MVGSHDFSTGLRVRPMRAADVPDCARILSQEFSFEGFSGDLVCGVFPVLLEAGRLKGAVVESDTGSIAGFGASVFVKDILVEHIYTRSAPALGPRLIHSTCSPDPLVCDYDSIATGNAGTGLNVFILHSGAAEVEKTAEAASLKAQLMQSFLELHQGYHVAQVLVEAFSSAERELYEATSFRIVDDYSSFRGWDSLPHLPAHRRPRLYAFTREDVSRMATHPLLPLFVYHRPRCGFTTAEQDLIREALEGYTDQELAVRLNLSVSAVKKRWIRVTEKVHMEFPHLFRARSQMRSSPAVRGAQTRHIVLRYLRSRPEELTPYHWSEDR
jgi:DNA-binding CsgD family transcriptional regulator